MDLHEFRETAELAARRGGDILEEWASKFTVSEKSQFNLVTEADLASQTAICKFITERYPDHGFLGEEGLVEDHSQSGCRWIIDPLDGTSNYVHRFPYYGVSIALEIDGKLQVGVVYDPTRDEMFSAAAGLGSTVNGSPLSPSTIDGLDRALVMASLPLVTDKNDPAVQRFLTVLSQAQHLQRTGSAALNLAYVAAGRMEAYWSSSLKPWDMAGGAVILLEAGGRISKTDGSAFDVEVADMLASNGTPVHEQLVECLA
ncbi:MAG: inositol monophosphatase family protein [Planctomycetota bacterium]|nr:inositol monophosphatase family protein [Planctomycetota bacterium]